MAQATGHLPASDSRNIPPISSSDDQSVEALVTAYCLTLSVRLGFGTFVPQKGKSKSGGDGAFADPATWHPSTAFVAASSLSSALLDVASRSPGGEALSEQLRLAAAARQLHGLVFQPYHTWLKAVRLTRSGPACTVTGPAGSPNHHQQQQQQQPNPQDAGAKAAAADADAATGKGAASAPSGGGGGEVPGWVTLAGGGGGEARLPLSAETLHRDLGDLALYWMINCDGANLRHTPEVLWFLFHTAQMSAEAAQVLACPDPAAYQAAIARRATDLQLQQLLPSGKGKNTTSSSTTNNNNTSSPAPTHGGPLLREAVRLHAEYRAKEWDVAAAFAAEQERDAAAAAERAAAEAAEAAAATVAAVTNTPRNRMPAPPRPPLPPAPAPLPPAPLPLPEYQPTAAPGGNTTSSNTAAAAAAGALEMQQQGAAARGHGVLGSGAQVGGGGEDVYEDAHDDGGGGGGGGSGGGGGEDESASAATVQYPADMTDTAASAAGAAAAGSGAGGGSTVRIPATSTGGAARGRVGLHSVIQAAAAAARAGGGDAAAQTALQPPAVNGQPSSSEISDSDVDVGGIGGVSGGVSGGIGGGLNAERSSAGTAMTMRVSGAGSSYAPGGGGGESNRGSWNGGDGGDPGGGGGGGGGVPVALMRALGDAFAAFEGFLVSLLPAVAAAAGGGGGIGGGAGAARQRAVAAFRSSVRKSLGDYGPDGKGYGCAFVSKTVQPLFVFLVEQVYVLGKKEGAEAAVRVAYDDVTESMAHPEVVASVLALLHRGAGARVAAIKQLKDGARAAAGAGGLSGGGATAGAGGGATAGGAGGGAVAAAGGGFDMLDVELGDAARKGVATEADLWLQLQYLATSGLTDSPGPRVPLIGAALNYRDDVRNLTRPLEEQARGAGEDDDDEQEGAGYGGKGWQAAPMVTAKPAGVGGSPARGGAVAVVAGGGGDDAAARAKEAAAKARDKVLKDMRRRREASSTSERLDSLKALLRESDRGAGWWAAVAMRKTFQEHRSVAMPLIAFGRVYLAQLAWFYALAAWSWGGGRAGRWAASTSALHWFGTCTLWSLQSLMSVSVAVRKREGGLSRQDRAAARAAAAAADVEAASAAALAAAAAAGSSGPLITMPYFHSLPYRNAERSFPRRGPSFEGAWFWWAEQGAVLAAAWVAGAVVTAVVFTRKDNAVYQGTAAAYAGLVVIYEVVWRQGNTGGWARGHFFERLQGLLPGRPGAAWAASASNPIYSPAAHLRTGLLYLLGNGLLWTAALGLKFVFDYFVLVRPAQSRMVAIWGTNALAIKVSDAPPAGATRIAVDLDPLMAAMQAILLFLLSLVSTGVAYSLSAAVWGAVQGIKQGVGSIRNWSHVRAGFHRIQSELQGKLLTPDGLGIPALALPAAPQLLPALPTSTPAADTPTPTPSPGPAPAPESTSAYPTPTPEPTTASLNPAPGTTTPRPTLPPMLPALAAASPANSRRHKLPPPITQLPHHAGAAIKGVVEEAGLVAAKGASFELWKLREATLLTTAPVWNALVRSLRQRDLLSDAEARNMSFRAVDSLSPSRMLDLVPAAVEVTDPESEFADGGGALHHGSVRLGSTTAGSGGGGGGGGTVRWTRLSNTVTAANALTTLGGGGGGGGGTFSGLMSLGALGTLGSRRQAGQLESLKAVARGENTFLPPLAVYVAQIPQMLSSWKPTAEQLEVLLEAYVYWLALLVGAGALRFPGTSSDLARLAREREELAAAVAARADRRAERVRKEGGVGGAAAPLVETRREAAARERERAARLRQQGAAQRHELTLTQPLPQQDGSVAVTLPVPVAAVPAEWVGVVPAEDLEFELFSQQGGMGGGTASSPAAQAARRGMLAEVHKLVKKIKETMELYTSTEKKVTAARKAAEDAVTAIERARQAAFLAGRQAAAAPSAPAAGAALAADAAVADRVAAAEAARVAAAAAEAEVEAARDKAVEGLGAALHCTALAATKMRDLPPSVAALAYNIVTMRHYLQDHTLEVMHRSLAAVAARSRNDQEQGKDKDKKEKGEKGNKEKGQEEQGEAAAPVPFREDFIEVAGWLCGILSSSDEGTAPRNEEAVSLLAEFCSGLNCPNMPAPPPVAAMRSVTTLIPHYHETVIYALSSADAGRVLGPGLQGALGSDEVLFVNDSLTDPKPSQLLTYLLSEFPDEFTNLLQRCDSAAVRPRPEAEKGQPYDLYDFLPGGRLYEHRAQLLLWASFRCQTLSRTVDGMSMYRTALALQAALDSLELHAALQQQQQLQLLQPLQGEQGGAATAAGVAAAGAAAAAAPSPNALVLSKEQATAVRAALRDPKHEVVEDLVEALLTSLPGLQPLLDKKYGTLVASQVYASLASSRSLKDRWVAHGVSLLATRYPSLRVAYLEPVETVTLISEPDYAFKLAWHDSAVFRAVPLEEAARRSGTPRAQLHRERRQLWDLRAAELETLFRLRQPLNVCGDGGGPILGEGKPENQNAAAPYCTGLLQQAIDMNQDNTLAQSLKLRNVTREFESLHSPGGARHGPCQTLALSGPLDPTPQHVAIVGYPEWIFSYRCGLLADLAAATERTFGTQIQRVMGFPSAARAHYGHPDLWNRLFSMTRGGVSKPNAGQHVSEDVFGGYNALKRGGLSKYVSYISVGKGRDMGLDSILGFEGKISKGCGEQLMSRDVRFVGAHTDFFRSASLYNTGPGHFINTWVTVYTIRAGLWVMLLLLLGGVAEGSGDIAAAIGAVQILQLGTLPLLSFVFNMWMENGLAYALRTLLRQLIAGGLLFHIFRSVTSAFHLARATLFGGAAYIATGRGFSLQRKTLTQVYINYGRSHMYLGLDVLCMSILILVAGNNGGRSQPIPVVSLWSSFLVATALLAGPFWFTPFYFRLSLVLQDTREFLAWLAGSSARGVSASWSEWHRGELAALRDDDGKQVPLYRFWSTSTLLLPRAVTCTLSVMVAVTSAKFETKGVPDLAWVFAGSAATWLALAAWSVSKRGYVASGLKPGWRWVKGSVQVLILLAVCFVLVFTLFIEKRGLRFSSVLIVLYANQQAASLVVAVMTLWMPRVMWARRQTDTAYRQLDGGLGICVAGVLLLVCFIGEIGLIMVDKVQTLVQFNDRYYSIWAAGQDVDLGDGSGGSGSVQGLLRRPAAARSASGGSSGAAEADKAKKA